MYEYTRTEMGVQMEKASVVKIHQFTPRYFEINKMFEGMEVRGRSPRMLNVVLIRLFHSDRIRGFQMEGTSKDPSRMTILVKT